MNLFRTMFLPIVAVVGFSGCQDAAGPMAARLGGEDAPLEITFRRGCGLAEGRKQVYDAQSGVFHVHFEAPTRIGGRGSGLYQRSAFEVAKVNGPFVKPVVFRLTGVPLSYGCVGDPLALNVDVSKGLRDSSRLDGTCYALVADPLAEGPVDKTLFRVERREDAVTIEFSEKGQNLLKPGTMISFKVDTGW
jgi:hypothetical protein